MVIFFVLCYVFGLLEEHVRNSETKEVVHDKDMKITKVVEEVFAMKNMALKVIRVKLNYN